MTLNSLYTAVQLVGLTTKKLLPTYASALDAIWLFLLLMWPLPTTVSATPTLHTYRSTFGIGHISKNYLK